MKTTGLLIFCTFVLPLHLLAQSTRSAMVCIYDYQQAIRTGEAEKVDSLFSRTPYFLSSESDGDTFAIREHASFSQAMAAGTSGRDLVLYVHGDGSPIDELVRRGSDIPRLYDVDVLFFAWPSYKINTNRIGNYMASKQNVENSLQQFVTLVDSLNLYARKHNIRVTLMFHSLGNRFAKFYARYLINHPESVPPFENVVLNAACVYEFDHNIWVDILASKIRRKVYITVNENDKILQGASFFIERMPLLGARMGGSSTERAIYVNFTHTLTYADNDRRIQNSHTYFMEEVPREKASVRDFYHRVLHGLDLNLEQNPCLKKVDENSQGSMFCILP